MHKEKKKKERKRGRRSSKNRSRNECNVGEGSRDKMTAHFLPGKANVCAGNILKMDNCQLACIHFVNWGTAKVKKTKQKRVNISFFFVMLKRRVQEKKVNKLCFIKLGIYVFETQKDSHAYTVT